jgi:tetraacyldisaccharide 4'-kinase
MNAGRALAPLQAPYALAIALKNHAYDHGWLRARELAWPVISIGNLSVGGAGKTPVVIALANLLRARGLPVDVLSRGYGRRSAQAVERVDGAGEARRFGDEPLLIAQATGVPVYVGASRWAGGILAEADARSEAGVHLLDDGFGHRRLARSADIVVVHPADIADRLLPAGRLREPLSSLHRADFLVLREDDAESEAVLRFSGGRGGMPKPVWRVRRSLNPPAVAGSVVAFCGIAHPGEFFASLRAHGMDLRDTLPFRDHHTFSAADIRAIARRADGAGALLTTEKDFVRLTPAGREQLSRVAPLLPVPLRTEFLDADRCIATLLDLLAARQTPPGRPADAMRK